MNPIQARREGLGCSQQGLADFAGVRLRAVVNLERQRAAAGQAGPGHSPSGDRIAAAIVYLEQHPERVPQGDHERRWMTLP